MFINSVLDHCDIAASVTDNVHIQAQCHGHGLSALILGYYWHEHPLSFSYTSHKYPPVTGFPAIADTVTVTVTDNFTLK